MDQRETSQSDAAAYDAPCADDAGGDGLSRGITDIALRAICADVLGLSEDQIADFTDDTGLFGHLPELDSMAVAGLLTEMEDRLDITIDDDDIDGEMLETYGALLDFAHDKRSTA